MLKIKFGEGKYDNTVAKVRAMTNARHALTIILDGDRGDGFAIHVGGVTQPERMANTKRLVVAVAYVGRALVAGIERLTGMTVEQVTDAMRAERYAEGLDFQPSPERCSHCGANLPQTSQRRAMPAFVALARHARPRAQFRTMGKRSRPTIRGATDIGPT